MKFQGYKYSVMLNAQHNTSAQSSGDSSHRHTFSISLYINAGENTDVEQYRSAENAADNYFSSYSERLINEIPPFDKLNPTLENMAEVFFSDLSAVISESGYTLCSLEISDTPQRVYSVSSEKPNENILKNAALINERFESKADEKATPAKKSIPIPESSAVSENTKQTAKVAEEKAAPTEPLSWVYLLVGAGILVILGFVLMLIVKNTGNYPLGYDIHGHLFKTDLMYNELKKGNLYPIYTEYWYNGLQPYRYWPPMSYYFMSALEFLTSGNVMNAYLGFIWASFAIGGFGWLLFGRRLRRPLLGIFMGIAWFFLPDNIRVFFGEGNLPRMFIAMLLPMLFYAIWQFVDGRRKKMIIPVLILMLICVFSHLMISAMIGIGSFVFLLIYSISNRRAKESAQVILVELFSFAAAGIWVLPALKGGITAMNSDGSSGIMSLLASPLIDSLNPLRRFEAGNFTELYIGLSIALVALIGVLASNKKSSPGFISMLIVIAGTTTALTPIIQKLPLSELLWMRRFIPIAYTMFVIGLFEWKKLKKPLLVIICSLIVIDCIPSLNLSKYDSEMDLHVMVGDMEKSMIETELTQAKNITKSRISLMDLSSFGSMPSYAICSLDTKRSYVFGWAWQGASIASNIVEINEAYERGNYSFMFDRNKELGADSVIVSKYGIQTEDAEKQLYAAAQANGYLPAGEAGRAILFSLYTAEDFGVVTDYTAIAIGTHAALIPQILPYYREGDKNVIDEYTVDELAQYESIYLSGFFYNNKSNAESIIRELSEKGVKIYIDMSRIPSDPLTNRMTFLDVSAQPIAFYDKLPTLVTDDEIYEPTAFPEEYSAWNTVYLTGLSNSDGWAWFEDTKLDFIGKGSDENITFIGFNILFQAYSKNDSDLLRLMNDVMDMDSDRLPERTLVPIDIEYGHNQITVKTDYDNVNTTLSWQDNFSSEQSIRENINLLTVDSGTTVIKLRYPYLFASLALSAIGLVLEGLMLYVILAPKRPKKRMVNAS